jgi:hypothetical protein
MEMQTAVVSATWEAEVGGSLEFREFEANLSNTTDLSQENK